ncbi:hypothetical protein HZS_607 [Henneguya salminicola]|nr:hypothetical protein HZS_607 [Henneguya salminicola]
MTFIQNPFHEYDKGLKFNYKNKILQLDYLDKIDKIVSENIPKYIEALETQAEDASVFSGYSVFFIKSHLYFLIFLIQ